MELQPVQSIACIWKFERETWITIEKSKAILYHVDISKRFLGLPLENRVRLFAWIKVKE